MLQILNKTSGHKSLALLKLESSWIIYWIVRINKEYIVHTIIVMDKLSIHYAELPRTRAIWPCLPTFFHPTTSMNK